MDTPGLKDRLGSVGNQVSANDERSEFYTCSLPYSNVLSYS